MRTQTKYIAAVLTLAVRCSPALAWTGEVSWPTFYRAGPGLNYTVLDELDRGDSLEVLACKDGWCLVRNGHSIGYAQREWIVQPSSMPEKPRALGLKGCVQSTVTGSGYRGGLVYRFCPQSTQESVPRGQSAPASMLPSTR